MRRILAVSALALVARALVGCGGSSAGPEPELSVPTDVGSWDTLQGFESHTSVTLQPLVSEGLAAPARDFKSVVPALAEQITHNDGYTEWTARLRAGARFSDGKPVTAADVGFGRDLRAAPELRLSGVMAHIGRRRREPRLWAELAAWLAELVGELNRRWGGWRPAEIDLGGGLPAPRDPAAGGHEEPAPPLEDYAAATTESLRAGLRQAGVDPAGLVHEANRWRPIVVNRAGEPPTEAADLVGSSCGVEIVVLDPALPPVEPGDVVALLDTGANQDAGSCNFNPLPRPAAVLVSGSAAELIKRRETVAEVFSRDLAPARLRAGAVATPRVTGLDHASVTSGDLDRSLAFYCDLPGIPLVQRGEVEGVEAGAITGLGDSHVRFADLDLGDGRVLEPLQLASPPAPPLVAELHQAGSGHLALRVADADEAHAALTAAGVEVRSVPIELPEPGDRRGVRCFYTEDPDGVVVEVVARPPATNLEGTKR